MICDVSASGHEILFFMSLNLFVEFFSFCVQIESRCSNYVCIGIYSSLKTPISSKILDLKSNLSNMFHL